MGNADRKIGDCQRPQTRRTAAERWNKMVIVKAWNNLELNPIQTEAEENDA